MNDEIYGFEEILQALDKCKIDFDKKSDKLLNNTAIKMKAETQSRTAVRKNVLRPSWTFDKIQKNGKTKTVNFGSNINYANFYEVGHKTKNGGFVKGRFPVRDSFTIAKKEFKADCDDLMKEVLSEFEL